MHTCQPASPEDKESEDHFMTTHSRDENGRFVVRLPFVMNLDTALGYSRDIAINQLLQIERRLSKDQELATGYREFMREFESLGHMRKI